jgi:2-desacetyl-2-hydroxyethyl bacteriochlorophyllide A dehydrogenase
MKAVRLIAHGSPLEACELPDPSPAAGEVVVDVRAAGICHSDAHYRSEPGRAHPPLTLGHEVAGVVSAIGRDVTSVRAGDRVALHYLLSCGRCERCRRYGEQFCESGAMLGKERDGGYAERVVIPERNAVRMPDDVPFDAAAIMMCSTATAYHALRLSDVRPTESLAILGFGGLGVSAAQLAAALGVREIFAVDIVPEKRDLAESFGATPVDLEDLHDIDVALELTGNATVAHTALRALAPGGRLMIVAIDLRRMELDPFQDLLARERRIIGCSDHTRAELVELLELARSGALDLSRAITRRVPREADAINEVLDDLERHTGHLRTVIV